MEIHEKKAFLINYLATADEQKVAAIFTLIGGEAMLSQAIPEDQKSLINEARDRDMKGDTPSMPWEDVHERLKLRVTKDAV